jgi:prephenate dehydrogenase
MIRRLTIVGLGLLGGSAAMAARKRGLVREVVAVGRRADRLAAALHDGVADRATTDLADGVRGADLILLATPVTALQGLLAEVWRLAEADALVTDVGSTKASIVRAAEELARSRPLAFVGGHPMAGSEQSGYAAARPDLFEGALVILTPTERTDPAAVKRVSEFWEAVGGRVAFLEPDAHDRAIAAVSHLPHLVAFALVDAVARLDAGALGLGGRGFADTTRIAASDPEVWRDIFATNRKALAEALGTFRAALDELERLVRSGDTRSLEASLARIREVRRSLP